MEDQDLAKALTREKTKLDQVLTLSFSVYLSISQEASEGQTAAEDRERRLHDALIAIVRYADLRARSQEPEPDDPELAWVDEASAYHKYLGRQALEIQELADTLPFSADDVDEQRNLYREMRSLVPLPDDPQGWTGASVRPPTGPIL